jgi:hypothetical protein
MGLVFALASVPAPYFKIHPCIMQYSIKDVSWWWQGKCTDKEETHNSGVMHCEHGCHNHRGEAKLNSLLNLQLDELLPAAVAWTLSSNWHSTVGWHCEPRRDVFLTLISFTLYYNNLG